MTCQHPHIMQRHHAWTTPGESGQTTDVGITQSPRPQGMEVEHIDLAIDNPRNATEPRVVDVLPPAVVLQPFGSPQHPWEATKPLYLVDTWYVRLLGPHKQATVVPQAA